MGWTRQIIDWFLDKPKGPAAGRRKREVEWIKEAKVRNTEMPRAGTDRGVESSSPWVGDKEVTIDELTKYYGCPKCKFTPGRRDRVRELGTIVLKHQSGGVDVTCHLCGEGWRVSVSPGSSSWRQDPFYGFFYLKNCYKCGQKDCAFGNKFDGYEHYECRRCGHEWGDWLFS